jgi:MCP family monocarboxylic acid transporter-like MFS transporter 14
MLVSIIGLINTMGRILAGWLADQPCVSPLVMTTLVVSGAAPLLYIFSVCNMMWNYALVSAVFGLLTGMWVSVAPATLTDLLGVDLLAQAFGFLSFFRGFAALSGPPIAGASVDGTGSPSVALIVAGGIMTGAAVIYIVTIGVNKKLTRIGGGGWNQAV